MGLMQMLLPASETLCEHRESDRREAMKHGVQRGCTEAVEFLKVLHPPFRHFRFLNFRQGTIR